jgi:hypothetical protein
MEHNDMDELLSDALLQEAEFRAEKSHLLVFGPTVVQQDKDVMYDYADLAIPRR